MLLLPVCTCRDTAVRANDVFMPLSLRSFGDSRRGAAVVVVVAMPTTAILRPTAASSTLKAPSPRYWTTYSCVMLYP